jgi:multidrug resistance efflux pump
VHQSQLDYQQRVDECEAQLDATQRKLKEIESQLEQESSTSIENRSIWSQRETELQEQLRRLTDQLQAQGEMPCPFCSS